MADTAATHPPPEPGPSRSERRTYRDLHRRSYEVELLISGAVLFALLQVPEHVDVWYRRLDPTLSGAAETAAYMLYYYLKLILYTLVTALVLHLAVRAYWVGLIGLNSVFPRGVRWENAAVGPVQRAVLREKAPSLRAMMRGTDALASVVFSVAFSLVWIFALSIVYVALVGAVALGISVALLDGEHVGVVGWSLGGVLFALTGGVSMVDRWLGHRIDQAGRTGRAFRRLLAFNYHALLQGFYAPLSNVLMSNVRRSLVTGLLWGAMVGMGAVFLVNDVMLPAGGLRLGGGGHIPDRAGPYALEDAYYDDRRDPPWSAPRHPSIPSEVVRAPYVRLFVPHHPERDAEALEALCPGLEPLAPRGLRIVGRRTRAPEDAAMERTLTCLGRLWTVTLDGRTLAPSWRFATRPDTDIPGIVTFIPAAELAAGEHLLALELVRPTGEQDAGDDADEEDEPPVRHHIPFWL